MQRGATTPQPRGARRGAVARLKMKSVLMKATELKKLWKFVKAGEIRPLTSADLAFLLRLRYALIGYEAAAKLENIQKDKN